MQLDEATNLNAWPNAVKWPRSLVREPRIKIDKAIVDQSDCKTTEAFCADPILVGLRHVFWLGLVKCGVFECEPLAVRPRANTRELLAVRPRANTREPLAVRPRANAPLNRAANRPFADASRLTKTSIRTRDNSLFHQSKLAESGGPARHVEPYHQVRV